MKNLILLFFRAVFILSGIPCIAQSLLVNTGESGVLSYSLNNLRKVTFSADSMHLHLSTSQMESLAKSDILSMYFEAEPLSASSKSSINKSNLKIYPIPNEGAFTLEYSALETGVVTWELMDLRGLLVYNSSFMVDHLGDQLQKINLPDIVSNGLYLIRLRSTNTEVFSKIFIQQ
jgi:hypothetical protein